MTTGQANPDPMHAPHLKTRLHGVRFCAPETERQYMAWRIRESVPLIRLAIYTGVGSIVSVPLAFAFIDQALFWEMLPVMLGLTLPAQIAGLVALRLLAPGRWVFGLISALILVPGAAIVWVCYWIFHDARLAILGAVLAALYAPFIRVPPGLSMLAIAPFLGLANYALWSEFQSGAVTAVSYWVATLGSVVALITILIVCVAVESLSRRAYAREQVIADQRNALDRSHRTIRRYIPPTVAEQIIAGNEAEISAPIRRRVTILFCDIVGFTEFVDRVEPEVVTQVINEYMAAMSQIVDAHSGTVNEFIGDGLMALFGAPVVLDAETQARQALQSAMAMQAKLPVLNRQWRKLGLGGALRIRIGINTGMVSVGSFGSEGRMTYTAIGLQTNIAARIQSYCEPDSILISEATYSLLDDWIACRRIADIDCKGVHYPVAVYAPMETHALAGTEDAVTARA